MQFGDIVGDNIQKNSSIFAIM